MYVPIMAITIETAGLLLQGLTFLQSSIVVLLGVGLAVGYFETAFWMCPAWHVICPFNLFPLATVFGIMELLYLP